MELALYREYRDVLPMFHYVVETDRRFYLCNEYQMNRHEGQGSTWFELVLHDAWVWDVYRPARFVSEVKVHTFKDVNIEEIKVPEKNPLDSF